MPENAQPNPYVGPRPFSTRDRQFFFGREREIAELRDLLIARRVVLLFSPSGAGKTSLVQAGLIPDLCELGYAVLPTLRVNSEVPPVIRQATPNRYLFSTLVSLEESLPEAEHLPLDKLGRLNLVEYLEMNRARDLCAAPDKPDQGQVLVFDQFEELLSLDPTDVPIKQAFLQSLAPVLRNPAYFVLFSMREDYVGSLDPYLRLFPDRLVTRYRIDLLSEKVALEAVRKPARQVEPPVDFHQEAAAELVDDLRQMRLQQTDGSLQLVPGPNIEPIMLQVVCQRLWEKRSSPQEITLSDVQHLRSEDQEALGEYGGAFDQARMSPVDLALGSYYAARVAEVAQFSRETAEEGQRVPERLIRDWFDSKLITPQGLRSMVLRDALVSQGLDNEIIAKLVGAHLVRAEPRRGLLWYELTHDRFIEPVRQNNTVWFKQHLKPLQRQAILWEREGRPQGLLISGKTLEEAEAWVRAEKPELTGAEKELLAASQDLAASARREMRRLRIFVTVVALLAIVAGLLAVSSFVLRGQARSSESRALTQGALASRNEEKALTQEALAAGERNAALSSAGTATAALATSVADRATSVADRATATAALGDFIAARATADANLIEAQRAQGQAEIAISRKLASEALAAASKDPALAALLSVEAYCAADTYEARNALLTSIQTGVDRQIQKIQTLPVVWPGLNRVAISPVTERLAWVMRDGFVTLWNQAENTFEPNWTPPDHAGTVWSVAFSPDGRLLVTGGLQPNQLFVTNLETGEIVTLPAINQVRDLAFHPTRPWLAVVILSTPYVYDTDTWELVEMLPTEDFGINSITWSADGETLIAGLEPANPNLDAVVAWRVEGWTRFVIHRSTNLVHSVAASPDGRLLAAGGVDNLIRLWEPGEFTPVGDEPLAGHGFRDVLSLSFSWDGRLLASGGSDNRVVIWDTTTLQPVATLERDFSTPVVSLEFSPVPGSYKLLVGSSNGQVGLYEVTPALSFYDQVTAPSGMGEILALGINADQGLFAAQSDGLDTHVVRLNSSAEPTWQVMGESLGFGSRSGAFDPFGEYLALGRSDQNGAFVFNYFEGDWFYETGFENIFPAQLSKPLPIFSLGFLMKEDSFSLDFDLDESLVDLAVGICGTLLTPDRCAENQNTILYRTNRDASGWELDAHAGTITALAYFASGEDLSTGAVGEIEKGYLVSGSLDKQILLWDLSDPDQPQIAAQVDTPAGVTSLAFSRDQRILAVGLDNRSVQFYDVLPGEPPILLPVGVPISGAPGQIKAMVFDQDNHLFTGSGGALLQWPSTSRDWGLRACQAAQAAGRSLSPQEWAGYMGSDSYAPACQNVEADSQPVDPIDICENP